jgi:hypothetical protein
MNDFKLAIHQFLKNPGFTAVAVLTLALSLVSAKSPRATQLPQLKRFPP